MARGKREEAPPANLGEAVKEAMQEAHEARRRYHVVGSTEPSETRLATATAGLHSAAIEYYNALKPFKDKQKVKSYWNSVALWEVPQLVSDENGNQTVKMAPLRGFDNLRREAVRFEEKTETVQGWMGTHTRTRRVPQRLPPDVLVEVINKLDVAALKLGFAPSIDDSVMKNLIDEEMGDDDPDEESADDGRSEEDETDGE